MAQACIVLSLVVLVLLARYVVPQEVRPKNVLFLVSDDLRPQLGCYSGPDFPSAVSPPMYTPHLDKLASGSLLLKRAYVQHAVCSPSRASFLTGRRPDTTHVYDLDAYFRTVGGDFTTIPEYFKMHGYRSVGLGKIFHPGEASGQDDPISWSEPSYHPPGNKYWRRVNQNSWHAVPPEVRRRHSLPDEQVAARAVRKMRRLALKSERRPFFLAVGFHKPHLPFLFPEEFLDHYPLESIRVPDNQYAPVGMPEVAWTKYNELRSFRDIENLGATGEINTTLPADVVRDLRRAYYSSVSYMDSLVGLLLGELEELGLQNDTIVSFIGDHGWQLGEHGEWAKHTNFEVATHAPMMVRVPGLTDGGVTTEQLTEFVDLFPTLVEAAGLPALPLCPAEGAANVSLCREGSSLLPLARNPESGFKTRVFSQFRRKGGKVMGYSMRTDRFRYCEWARFEGAPIFRPDWSRNDGVELYDHMIDPDENYNVADDPSYVEVREELRVWLHAGWRAALPED